MHKDMITSPDNDLDISEILNAVLISIALQELGVYNILNSLADKLNKLTHADFAAEELLAINRGILITLKLLIRLDILHNFNYRNIGKLIDILWQRFI